MIIAECKETGFSIRLAPAHDAIWLNIYHGTEWLTAGISFRWAEGHWYVSGPDGSRDELGYQNSFEKEMTPYGVVLKARAVIREKWEIPRSFDTEGLIVLLSPESMALISPALEVMES